MDNQVMKKMIFSVFKNIIIEQNKVLLKIIADKYDLDYEELLKKYITPDNYLPVVVETNK
jgi:transcription initiation factor IIE alpha subunit